MVASQEMFNNRFLPMAVLSSLAPAPPAPASSASTTSTIKDSTGICNPATLLQHYELGAAVLQVMFRIRWLDHELHGGNPVPVKAPIRGSQPGGLDGPSKVADNKRLTQNLARDLFDALNALDAFCDGRPFELNMKQIHDAEDLPFLLASNVSAQAIADDRVTAEAVQDDGELPPETICQSLVQRAEFTALRGGEDTE